MTVLVELEIFVYPTGRPIETWSSWIFSLSAAVWIPKSVHDQHLSESHETLRSNQNRHSFSRNYDLSFRAAEAPQNIDKKLTFINYYLVPTSQYHVHVRYYLSFMFNLSSLLQKWSRMHKLFSCFRELLSCLHKLFSCLHTLLSCWEVMFRPILIFTVQDMFFAQVIMLFEMLSCLHKII